MNARTFQPPAIIGRSLSVNEPWAWAIIAGPASGIGFKPIENRTWATPFTGRLALHASTSKRHCNTETEQFLFDAGPALRKALDDRRIGTDNPLFHFGAFLGTVSVVGCVQCCPDDGEDFDRCCREQGFGAWLDKHNGLARKHGIAPPAYWASGPVCWLLESPQQFTQPIPAKGKLNVYSLSAEEMAAVAKALQSPLGSPVEYRAKLASQAAAR